MNLSFKTNNINLIFPPLKLRYLLFLYNITELNKTLSCVSNERIYLFVPGYYFTPWITITFSFTVSLRSFVIFRKWNELIKALISTKTVRGNVKNFKKETSLFDTRCESHIEMGGEGGWNGRAEGAASKRSRIKYVGLTDDRNRAC